MLVSLQLLHHRVPPEVRIQSGSNKIVLMFESDALSQPPQRELYLLGTTGKRPPMSAFFRMG